MSPKASWQRSPWARAGLRQSSRTIRRYWPGARIGKRTPFQLSARVGRTVSGTARDWPSGQSLSRGRILLRHVSAFLVATIEAQIPAATRGRRFCDELRRTLMTWLAEPHFSCRLDARRVKNSTDLTSGASACGGVRRLQRQQCEGREPMLAHIVAG